MTLDCTAEFSSTEHYAFPSGFRRDCFAQLPVFACKQASKPPSAKAPRSKLPHPLLRFCAPPATTPQKSGHPRFTSPGTFRPWLFQAFDGLLLLWDACLVSCRRRSWGSKSTRYASGYPASPWFPAAGSGASPTEVGHPNVCQGRTGFPLQVRSSRGWRSSLPCHSPQSTVANHGNQAWQSRDTRLCRSVSLLRVRLWSPTQNQVSPANR